MKFVLAVTCLLYLNFLYGDPLDYKAILNNIHVDYINYSMVTPNSTFCLFKYNRTQFAFKASLWILQDLDGNDIESTTSIYLFLSNSFKATGLDLKVPNVCKMWKDNLYGIRTILTRCGDVDLCTIKKGYWHLDNCFPWESLKYYPKSLPHGSYKISMIPKLKNGALLAKFDFYGQASLYFKEMEHSKIKVSH